MISRDRIGVLIGENGRVKDQIERDLNVVLNVDAEAEVVAAKARDDANPLALLKAKDTVTAIARGFPPDKAFQLFDESVILDVLDLRELFGRARVIFRGSKGELSGEMGNQGGALKRSLKPTSQSTIMQSELSEAMNQSPWQERAWRC